MKRRRIETGSSRTGPEFYDEMNDSEIASEAREHESGRNSDGNLSSHSHHVQVAYSPEVSICNLNIYFSPDKTA